MPASQEVDVFRGLKVEVEPVDDEPDVYFTDQAPKFKLIIRNDTEYNFIEGSQLTWVLGIGSGMPQPIYKDEVDFIAEPGETKEIVIGGKLLAFEGHGVVGVNAGGARGSGDPHYELNPGRGSNYDPVYTFSVWDQSQYESIHENPKRMQKIAMFLTGAVVLFSLIQLFIALLPYL